MPNLRMILALTGAALTLTACVKNERQDPSSGTAVDIAAIQKTIMADEKKWSDQFQANPRSVDDLTSHYAEDAYFVAPGVKGISGKPGIRKAYEEGLKDPNFNVTFSSDNVGVAKSGDIAYSQGRFHQQWTDPKTKKVVSGDGTFLTVYQKQADGSWKAVKDCSMLDPPPQEPAAI